MRCLHLCVVVVMVGWRVEVEVMLLLLLLLLREGQHGCGLVEWSGGEWSMGQCRREVEECLASLSSA